MKTTIKLTIGIVTLGISTLLLMAQGQGHHPRPPRGESDDPGHRPPPPVIAVLDANHDHVIDQAEIANASQALLTLDLNGDGQLTPDELRPPRHAPGPGGPVEEAPDRN